MIVKNIKKQAGFSLAEVLLVLAIFLIIAASTAALLGSNSSQSSLIAKSREVVSIINRARDNSMSGYLGDSWGIDVLDDNTYCDEAGVTPADCIVMFKGSVFVSRDRSHDKKVKLSNGIYVDSSEKNEFYFAYNSGWLASSTGNLSEQLIILKSNDGSIKHVSTTPFGLVYWGD